MISIPTWGDQRNIKVGILGGSFNPVHSGHLQLARRAFTILQLDQVWLMVSPGNPLKTGKEMASFSERFQGVQKCVDGRHIIATDIESRLHTRYSYDTLKKLYQRFPNCKFVWLMGADGLSQMAFWSRWQKILRLVPIAIFPRPPYIYKALNGKAAQWARSYRLSSQKASVLASYKPPAWVFVPSPENKISATALRAQGRSGL